MALTQVNSAGIKDDAIVNADVKSDAAIAGSKLVAATTSVPGSMSAADKTKLDGVAASANAYVHPNHSGDVTSTADGATVIAAGAVDIAMLATGTDGKIITWDANGAPTVVGPGTDGQVLTSTGAGSPPAFEDAASGFNPDAAHVFNESGADVDFRVESDDNEHMIFVNGGDDRVGIGRSTPITTLDVNGNMAVDATGNSYGNKFVVGATNPNSTASGSGYGWGIGSSGGMYWNMHDENSYWNSANSGNNHYIQMRTKASGVGNIHIQQSSVAYNTSSDYRLKENINYTWDATSRLKQLKPARFNWIIDDTNTLVDGFIAHEVSSIVPEAVSGEKDAVEEDGSVKPQGIDQAKLVPLLVKTIQELEARITALEAAG